MIRTLSLLMIAVGIAGLLTGCEERQEAVAPIHMRHITFEDLDGWSDDRQSEALAAFRRSCVRVAALPADGADGPLPGVYGQLGDWLPACAAAQTVPPGDPAARVFFETWFSPLALSAPDRPDGLFTGYYEPEIKASRTRTGPYQTPVLGPPPDLVTADLGQFDPKFAGERLRGRVAGGRFVPYPARAEIERGVDPSAAHQKVLAWIADPVEAFFMHIQGSGRLLLEDGNVLRLAFAEKNGRPYTAIGRVLVDRGALAPGTVSMQTIRAWLAANPEQMSEILAQNQSYIFFRPVPAPDPASNPAPGPTLGPPGAGGVPLTPGRSLAVDRAFHALGAPLWLDTQAPTGPGGALAPFRRLMITQDTGSAIKGPVRGDVFWGSGEAAGEIAGLMQQFGRLTVLLPKPLAARTDDR